MNIEHSVQFYNKSALGKLLDNPHIGLASYLIHDRSFRKETCYGYAIVSYPYYSKYIRDKFESYFSNIGARFSLDIINSYYGVQVIKLPSKEDYDILSELHPDKLFLNDEMIHSITNNHLKKCA